MTTIRTATPADRAAIVRLQRLSLRTLGRHTYSDFEIESYLRYTPTLEEYLLADSTYYVAHIGEHLAGCGGWSVKAPAYGAITTSPPDRTRNVPKIRAMYVHPVFARRGIGHQLLDAIEQAIIDAGFDEIDIDATLTGVPLYLRCGYTPVGETGAALPNGARMRFVRMHKQLVSLRTPDAERIR